MLHKPGPLPRMSAAIASGSRSGNLRSLGGSVPFELLLVCACLFWPHSVWAQDRALRFVSERVTLGITHGRLDVVGEYVFRGTRTAAGAPILYPFLRDSTLGAPEVTRVDVKTGTTWRPLGWRAWPDGVRFTLPIGKARCQVRIVYAQALRGDQAGYLLRSTAAWGEPLEKACFEVRLAKELREPVFNYPFRRGKSLGGRHVFVYTAAPFMPVEDLRVKWGAATTSSPVAGG